jgi:RimJ/RimL family protein N-acetyltransferase
MDVSSQDGLSLDFPVHSARLVLRAMTDADAPSFHALVCRPEVARMLFIFPTDWPLSAAAPFLQEWRWQGALRFRVAIEVQGVWAGWIGCTNDAEPEIFYALRPEFAGQGIAKDAVKVFCRFLFTRFAPVALRAGVFADNPASAHVLAACGFQKLGEDMQSSAAREAPAPGWLYRLRSVDFNGSA